MEYIIVGDTAEYKECLVYTCGKSKERAKEVLSRMLTNPDENDKLVMRGMFNFKIKTVEDEDCWWNDSVLMRE